VPLLFASGLLLGLASGMIIGRHLRAPLKRRSRTKHK
jgi:hypothetical protein